LVSIHTRPSVSYPYLLHYATFACVSHTLPTYVPSCPFLTHTHVALLWCWLGLCVVHIHTLLPHVSIGVRPRPPSHIVERPSSARLSTVYPDGRGELCETLAQNTAVAWTHACPCALLFSHMFSTSPFTLLLCLVQQYRGRDIPRCRHPAGRHGIVVFVRATQVNTWSMGRDILTLSQSPNLVRPIYHVDQGVRHFTMFSFLWAREKKKR
jgi:hypothetical protein